MIPRSDWYTLSIEKVLDLLEANVERGLTQPEVEKRHEEFGLNTLTEEKHKGLLGTLFEQLKSPLVFVLLAAGVVTVILHEYIDATVIGIALLINLVVGVVQEGRASKAFEKLNQSQEKFATVVRNGHRLRVGVEELVPGDYILLESGVYIPADARIVKSFDLAVNESILTGEWIDVHKHANVFKKERPLTGQENMVWMGTLATGGSAEAVVVATGDHTELGKIAQSLAEAGEADTPLQKSIAKLAKYLAFIILFAILLIFALGFFRDESLTEMFLISIAIAVAAIPSGLPAAVTVVLALGMETILKEKGLVRNLLAAETLGSTTIILTDKTGTLTKAKMGVASLVTYASISKHATTHTDHETPKEHARHDPDSGDMLAMSVMTSDAFVEGYNDALKEWVVRGRPVERAVVIAGLEAGLTHRALLEQSPQLDVMPFESQNRFAASLQSVGKTKKRVYLTGAPEFFLDAATHVYHGGAKKKLTKKIREEFAHTLTNDTSRGLRLIGVAYREVTWDTFPDEIKRTPKKMIEELVFCGFIELHDPVREEVPHAIEKARLAGAQVIMITGDNEHTAQRVAEEVGIITRPDGTHKVLKGEEIEKLNDKELLARLLHETRVIARVLPQQKMRIANVLKEADEVVAMTGDGINDAPALRSADIGVALGSGTEVAKEAADIVLLNNSFSIIVKAIEEGRRILDNLKKIVTYLLSTSFSEVFLVGASLVAGTPLPLLPTQILWTNIIEEGFMNFSFAFEPGQDDVMTRSPRTHSMRMIVTGRIKALVLILSTITGITLVAVYFALLALNLPIEEVRTVMFVLLSFESIFFIFSIKDLGKPVWKINLFNNRYLIFALLASVGTLLIAIYAPPLQKLLSLTSLHIFDVAIIFLVGIFNVALIEAAKYLFFIRRHTTSQ